MCMNKRLKLKVIACDVLNREISLVAARSPHFVDVRYLPQGLHNTPDILRERVMEAIRATEADGFPYNHTGREARYDAIILMYGLCSNGLSGVTCLDTPLVLPRAHDCITLLLGSKERYRALFDGNPGTYWYSPGGIERGGHPAAEKGATLLETYTTHYGEENAAYLMEMEQNWIKEYKQALYIAWPDFDGLDWGRAETRAAAAYLRWAYQEVEGAKGLMERLLGGVFHDGEALVVRPGERIVPSYGPDVVRTEAV